MPAALGLAPKGPIPAHAREPLRARLERHAETRWAGRCREIAVRFRGPYAYVDAYADEPECPPWTTKEQRAGLAATPTHLCRLGYLGSADLWAFAFYKYSDESYEPSVLFSGSPVGAPEEAFDCAAFVYLQG